SLESPLVLQVRRGMPARLGTAKRNSSGLLCKTLCAARGFDTEWRSRRGLPLESYSFQCVDASARLRPTSVPKSPTARTVLESGAVVAQRVFPSQRPQVRILYRARLLGHRRPERAPVICREARLHGGDGRDERLHRVARAVVGGPERLIEPVRRAGPREA